MPSAYTLLDLTAPAHHATPDLVVDGRPLLHRLDEAEGVDTVSPLASDLPPVLHARHLGALVTTPPRGALRRTLYACPDCDGPGCGAVTVLVEHDGEDIVWRDFAWQTENALDLERDGYPGVGPYRFRADAYHSVLLRAGADTEAGRPLVGAAA